MAKRFVDTTLWDRDWFLKLTPKMKLAWVYLTTSCDHSGIWHISMSKMSFEIGEGIDIAELTKALPVLVIEGDKLFITGFIQFQYGCKIDELNPNNNAHKSVITNLKKYGLDKPLPSPSLAPAQGPIGGAQDKDQDRDMDKDQESPEVISDFKTSSVSKFENGMKFNLHALYDIFPRQEKKAKSLSLLAEIIHTQSTYDRMTKAIANYDAHTKAEATERRYILTMPSFLNEWEDWVDRQVEKPKDPFGFLNKPEGAA